MGSYFEVHPRSANQTSGLCNRKRCYENLTEALPLDQAREVTGNFVFYILHVVTLTFAQQMCVKESFVLSGGKKKMTLHINVSEEEFLESRWGGGEMQN